MIQSKRWSSCFLAKFFPYIFLIFIFSTFLLSVQTIWAQTPPLIPQNNFTKYWVDSEELVAENSPGEKAFDGDPLTHWHTQWLNASPPHPHSLQIDLGAVYSIGGIRYKPRDPSGGANGRIGQYELYVAADSGTPPTIPPVFGQWTLVASGSFPNTATEQEVLFNTVSSRYVWLRALSEAQNKNRPWTTVGEFNVLGTLVTEQVVISPSSAEVSPGGQQQFTGSGGTPPYAFIILDDTSGGASIDFNTGLYTAGPNAGTSTIRMADSTVPELSAQATVTVTEPSSGTFSPIPQNNFTKYWVDSEELVAENSPGEKAFDGDPLTHWHTQWLNASPPHPHSLQIDLGAVYSIGGIRYKPRDPSGGANGRIGQYELYVAADSGTPPTIPPVFGQWTLVASGSFPNTATEQEVLFNTVSSRYVWLRALSEAQNKNRPWTTVGEFNVLGTSVGGSGSNLGISPSMVTLAIGAQQTFEGMNGTPPYVYSLVGDTSGGATVNSSTGLYTAGPIAGTSTVRVTDAGSHTADANITVTAEATFLNKGGWTVHFVNSQTSGNPATAAFDGNPATSWRTTSTVSPPHDLQINLGNVFEIEGFQLSPLTPYGAEGISFYEFYVSKDGVNWGMPVASGDFANDTSLKTRTFSRITGQFVRIIARGAFHGRRSINLAELDVIGAPFTGNHDPDGSITAPTGNLTINAGGSVSFAGTYADPNGDPPGSFLWNFGDPAIPDATVKDPGQITFNNPGTYTVTFTVSDSLGRQDPFPAKVVIKVLDGPNTVLPRGEWRIHYVNSEEVIQHNDAAVNVLDGNSSTLWHSQWNNVAGPHDIQINLGSVYSLDALRYLPRPSGQNGRIKRFHIYVSEDGHNWGQPVAIGDFVNSSAEQRVQFSSKAGQFVRVAALSEVNNKQWASMAELNLEGRCRNPSVKIHDPLTKDVQSGPNLKVAASVCLTHPLHAGWGVKVAIDGGGQQQTILMPADGMIRADTFLWTFSGIVGDNHEVEAFIVDQSGNAVPGSTTYDKVTHVGIGGVYGALGDSITVGIGDDDPTDGTSQDGRNTNTETGFIPLLNDLLTAKQGFPHNIYNEGVQGETSAGLLIRAPGFLKKRPKAKVFLILVGTNDASSGLVPSGAGSDPPAAGTYKDNLQKVIDLIRDPSMGREVYLAKVPFSLSPAKDDDIQGYNQAIEELAASNGIPVIPPDFYSHFQSHQSELIDNVSHPNGAGFRSMSTLWCVAITSGVCDGP